MFVPFSAVILASLGYSSPIQSLNCSSHLSSSCLTLKLEPTEQTDATISAFVFWTRMKIQTHILTCAKKTRPTCQTFVMNYVFRNDGASPELSGPELRKRRRFMHNGIYDCQRIQQPTLVKYICSSCFERMLVMTLCVRIPEMLASA